MARALSPARPGPATRPDRDTGQADRPDRDTGPAVALHGVTRSTARAAVPSPRCAASTSPSRAAHVPR